MTQLWVTADDLDDPTLDDAADAARAATSILFALSGRKYPGPQTITETYQCSHESVCDGLSASRGRVGRSPHRHDRLRLRGTPVRRVLDVMVGDDMRSIDNTEWDVIDRTWLKPTKGASWRPCQKLTIRYIYGAQVPELGKRAARVLANELVRARIAPDTCKLPDRVTSISRQGLSLTVLDPQDFLADGRTGLYEVDLFLKSVNPDKARKRAKVFTPDMVKAERVTSGALPDSAGQYDLLIVKGIRFFRTFRWSQSGVNQAITGAWTPQALVRNHLGYISFDLAPYLVVEPSSDTGRIDLDIPSAVTSTLALHGTWKLTMVRNGDPTNTVPLLAGGVTTATQEGP